MKKQNWHPVESSQIKQIAHDTETQTLYVQFNTGGIYSYEDFPAEKFEAFLDADSKGKFLGAAIKGKHAYKKITDEKIIKAMGFKYDVVAIEIKTNKVRLIGSGKEFEDAEAIVKMAVMRRGVEEEFFAECISGKFKEGDLYKE